MLSDAEGQGPVEPLTPHVESRKASRRRKPSSSTEEEDDSLFSETISSAGFWAIGHSPDFLPSILSLFFWFLLLDPSRYLLATWSYHQGQHLLPPSMIFCLHPLTL